MEYSTPILVNHSDFDLHHSLKASVNCEQNVFDYLFSLSPLTSDTRENYGEDTGDATMKAFGDSPLTTPDSTPPSISQSLPLVSTAMSTTVNKSDDEFCPGASSLNNDPPQCAPTSSAGPRITPPLVSTAMSTTVNKSDDEFCPGASSLNYAPPQCVPSSSAGPHITPKDEIATSKKSHQKKQSHENRQRKREAARQSLETANIVKAANTRRHLKASNPIATTFDMSASQVVSTAFTGTRDSPAASGTYTLNEIVGEGSKYGFRLQKWDGRTLMPLLDTNNLIFGVCAGQPNDSNWEKLHTKAASALEERRHRCHVPKKELRKNRRGRFVNVRCGISHGGGQIFPKTLCNSPHNQEVLDELNGMECFKRVAGFASNVMATWAPDLHDYYVRKLGTLYNHNPMLVRNFDCSILPTTTYNMGPQTVCCKHRDHNNLAFGWCAITALGSYDPTKGGHLVLWDCRLVIEFLPGSTILIPSAIIAHSNTRISLGETRYSFTQYAAGGLFRWVENVFKKADVYRAGLNSWQAVMEELKN